MQQDERAYGAAGGMGGDATLKMNVFKSLKALAGDNDNIFLILDDRDDLWRSEETGLPPTNLLLIPPYFFHSIHALPRKLSHLLQLYFNISFNFDVDLTLISFKNLLLGLHKRFFTNINKKLSTPSLC